MKPIILFVTILIIISACKKGGYNPPPPPPPAKDTSYLKKTEVDNNYDLTGKKLSDSSFFKWSYESKGRVVFNCDNFNNGAEIDTTITGYGSGQTTYDHVAYSGGTLITRTHEVDFYNSQGFVDSSVQSGFNINNVNTGPVNFSTTGITLYYFDASGNDTLDLAYNITNNSRSLERVTRKTYLNNSLSTTDEFTASGINIYSAQWNAGNVTSITTHNHTDGSLMFTYNYTYSSVLSGGFYVYTGTKNLMATYAQTEPGFPSQSFSETLAYTFDDANRVSTITRQYSNGQGNEEEVYTYY